jgi:hypothetical protein
VLLLGDAPALIVGLLKGLELGVVVFNPRKRSSRPPALDAICGFGVGGPVVIGVYKGGKANEVFQIHARNSKM